MRPYGYRTKDYPWCYCFLCYYNNKVKTCRKAAKKRARRKWKKEIRNEYPDKD